MKNRVANSILPLLVLTITLLSSDQRDALGDVNNDGLINVQDIIRVVNIILENDPAPSDYELWAGDVNSDESIDVTDIIILVNYILGTGILCEEGYSFCPGSITECCANITSHEIFWEVDTLGNVGSFSELFDVAVFNDSLIWVVGNITESNEYYNSSHWDGNNWSHQLLHSQIELFGIEYINDNDIWVTAGIPIHWDGEEWEVFHLYQMGVLEDSDGPITGIYYLNSENIFFIGDNGTLVLYNSPNFQKIDTGVSTKLTSISGTTEQSVWISGHNLDIGESRTTLLYYNGSSCEIRFDEFATDIISTDLISGVIKGVYTDDPDSIWVVTHLSMYVCPFWTTGEGSLISDDIDWGASIKVIDGNTKFDIFFAGANSTIWHYNGISFYTYNQLNYPCQVYGIDVNQNSIAVVGYLISTSQSIILRGLRE